MVATTRRILPERIRAVRGESYRHAVLRRLPVGTSGGPVGEAADLFISLLPSPHPLNPEVITPSPKPDHADSWTVR